MSILWLVVSTLLPSAFALDNGLVLTPPMGWFSWERFRCITDCKKYPNECISENLIKRTADRMVSDDYLAAGYNYVGIDDCWLEMHRDNDSRMVPDRERFPSGLKALSEYLHSKGLKFAIYQDYGKYTCEGYPGLLGHEKLDVDTFVDWDIDYLKVEGCYNHIDEVEEGFKAFGKMLNDTPHPIVYSCGWPVYLEFHDIYMLEIRRDDRSSWSRDDQSSNLHELICGGSTQSSVEQIACKFDFRKINVNYNSLAEHCNLWKNYFDIQDSWSSVLNIMKWFGDNQDRFAAVAGPGHWNDPDMLIIGNFGLSMDQARVQMAVWSVMAAPLFMSTDLATIRPEFREILLNEDIIAVDQDPLGKQGLRIAEVDLLEIWKRELANGSYAMAFVNKRDDGTPFAITFAFEEMTLPRQNYDIQDLYKEEKNRHLEHDQDFDVRINPTGVKFYKFTPSKAQEIAENNATMIVNNTLDNSVKFTPSKAQEIAENNATMIVNNALDNNVKFTPSKAQEIAENNATMILNNTLDNSIKSTPSKAQERAENISTMLVNNTH